jgi:hypothetical protein
MNYVICYTLAGYEHFRLGGHCNTDLIITSTAVYCCTILPLLITTTKSDS